MKPARRHLITNYLPNHLRWKRANCPFAHKRGHTLLRPAENENQRSISRITAFLPPPRQLAAAGYHRTVHARHSCAKQRRNPPRFMPWPPSFRGLPPSTTFSHFFTHYFQLHFPAHSAINSFAGQIMPCWWARVTAPLCFDVGQENGNERSNTSYKHFGLFQGDQS